MTSEPNRGVTASSDSKNWVIAVYITYIVGFAIVGVIIAYIKRPETQGTMWESHITYAIRTFWLGLAGVVIGLILTFILIGILVLWAVAIWFLVRAIVGLVQALNGKPIADPQTWLI